MRVIIHDLGEEYGEKLRAKCDAIICADGRYAPCQGCFDCWTKHPAECFLKDKLHEVCRVVGQADELFIISKNLYGGYDTQVKNVLDRAIGTSTPLSTYRKWEMHHTLRYGKHDLWKIIVWGDITDGEKAAFTYLVERNAVNHGYARSEIAFVNTPEEAEALI